MSFAALQLVKTVVHLMQNHRFYVCNIMETMHVLSPTGSKLCWVLMQVAPLQSGSLVYKIDPLAPAHEVLKENDGTVEFRNEERVEFSHIVRAKHIGEASCLSALLVCHVKTGNAERHLSMSIFRDLWAGPIQGRRDSVQTLSGKMFLHISVQELCCCVGIGHTAVQT